jgi:hypothetical protein
MNSGSELQGSDLGRVWQSDGRWPVTAAASWREPHRRPFWAADGSVFHSQGAHGLALHELDFALGVIARSLVNDGRPAELGFLAVLSVESIYVCLAENKLLPEAQKQQWGELKDFWSTEHIAAFAKA